MSVIIDKYGDVGYMTQNLNDNDNRKVGRGKRGAFNRRQLKVILWSTISLQQ